MNPRRLYVGQISRRATERDVAVTFERYGELTELDLRDGFAFVEFRKAEHAEEVFRDLDRLTILGQRVNIQRARDAQTYRDRAPRDPHYYRGTDGHPMDITLPGDRRDRTSNSYGYEGQSRRRDIDRGTDGHPMDGGGTDGHPMDRRGTDGHPMDISVPGDRRGRASNTYGYEGQSKRRDIDRPRVAPEHSSDAHSYSTGTYNNGPARDGVNNLYPPTGQLGRFGMDGAVASAGVEWAPYPIDSDDLKFIADKIKAKTWPKLLHELGLSREEILAYWKLTRQENATCGVMLQALEKVDRDVGLMYRGKKPSLMGQI